MDNSYVQVLLPALPYLIPKIVIAVTSIYFYLKTKSRIATLMAIGSFMSIASIIYSQINFLLISFEYVSSANYKLVNNISTIGYILFAVGFALLIVDLVKKLEETKNKDNQNSISNIGISRYN
jgi:hypothetical protein